MYLKKGYKYNSNVNNNKQSHSPKEILGQLRILEN